MERPSAAESMRAWAQLVFADCPGVALDFLTVLRAPSSPMSALMARASTVGENLFDEYVVRGDDPEHVLSQLERWELLQEDADRGRVLEVEWVFVSVLGGNDSGVRRGRR